MPEAPHAVVSKDVANDSDGRQSSGRGGGGGGAAAARDLNLALDELNGREYKRRQGAGERAGRVEGREGERRVAAGEAGRVQALAAERLEDEEGAGLRGGADEGRADAAVEAEEAIGAESLAEAVDRAGVAEGQVVGLALEADFDGVEGVFNIFTDDASNL